VEIDRVRGYYRVCRFAISAGSGGREFILFSLATDLSLSEVSQQRRRDRLMRRVISAVVATGLMFGLVGLVRADENKEAKAVIDKAVKALGGAEKLGACKATSWKAKGKINFGGDDNEFKSQTTVQGMSHSRQEFEGEFGGNQIKGVTILAGDKGWRKLGDDASPLENEALANQKRVAYLQVVPAMVLPLTEQGFKIDAVADAKVGDKPAVEIKVTGPDGKDFQIYFDKESGLPVKLVAKVLGFQNDEFTQETTFADYKDFDGIKRATKVEMKRDGQKFLDQQLSDFKVLDKVDPKAFEEPK
jgi:hypothetical protein